ARKLGQQARSFASLEQLETLYQKLAEYDFNIKTGRLTDETALFLFIAGVTR
ncbi:MAG: hypothetical protein HC915_14175, partial [Anaerolineae bacterium]|nr:hypothetical protein [Anaerolineae bacterium]